MVWKYVIVALILSVGTAMSQEEQNFDNVISMPEGARAELPVDGVQRYLIGAPNMLAAEQSDSKLLLTAKAQGTTVLAVWTDKGRTAYQVKVVAQLPDAAVEEPVRIAQAAGIQQPALPPIDVTIEPGQSYVIKGQKIVRTAVSDPSIVDIVPVSTSEILVNAKKEGATTVRIWDARGQSTYNFNVAKVQASPEEIAAEVTRQIGVPTITARMVGETVVLSGVAPTVDIAQKATMVAEALGRKVISLVTVESISAERVVASLKAAMPEEPLTYEVLPDQTVIIKGTLASEEAVARVQQIVQAWVGTPEGAGERTSQTTQISFTGGQTPETPPDVIDKARLEARQSDSGVALVKEEMNFSRHVFGGRITNGPRIVAILEVNPALAEQILVTAQIIEVDRNKLKTLGIQWGQILGENASNPLIITEDRPEPITLDKAGPFRRNTLTASIQALITENAARVLSQPQVLIADGHVANIQVGGEIPIPVSQNTAVGSASISVIFKPFGIQLTVRPKITPDNRILLSLTPEVSSLDFTNAVRAAGFEIPALRVRRATTTVHVADGQSIALGGLLSSEDVKTVDRVPLLSKIPVIGELFKSRRFSRNETELIVLVTPQIIHAGSVVPIPLPK